MYKLCKTEQSARRQRELEDGLLSAMLTKRYDEISVIDLCQQMQIPRKSFYRYFDSKDGALHALLDHRIMDYETQGHSERVNSFEPFYPDLPRFFHFWLEQKPLLDALAHSGLSGLLVTHAISLSHQKQFPDLGAGKYIHNRNYYSNALLFSTCGLMSLVIQWHHDGYQQSPAEMAEITYQLLSTPLLPRYGQQRPIFI